MDDGKKLLLLALTARLVQDVVRQLDLPCQSVRLLSIDAGKFPIVAAELRKHVLAYSNLDMTSMRSLLQPGHTLVECVEFMRASELCFKLEQAGAQVEMRPYGLIAMAATSSVGEVRDEQTEEEHTSSDPGKHAQAAEETQGAAQD